MKKLICVALLGIVSVAASAAPVTSGMVTGRNSNGVFLSNNQGVTFIPFSQARFRVNGRHIADRFVRDGMFVSVLPQGNFQTQYVPQAYYNTHRNWDWNQYQTGWNNDRYHWRQDRMGWHRY
ncbi:MAG: hypothetical protein U0931_12330 [Vulcanimicrobiota bacterium]